MPSRTIHIVPLACSPDIWGAPIHQVLLGFLWIIVQIQLRKKNEKTKMYRYDIERNSLKISFQDDKKNSDLLPSEMRNRMGFDCVNEEFGSILPPHVQYPSCSGSTFLNLMLQSVLSLPKAGNRFTSRFHGCDWFNCLQDHWHSRTDAFIWHIICAEDPAGTSTTLSSFANTIRGSGHL